MQRSNDAYRWARSRRLLIAAAWVGAAAIPAGLPASAFAQAKPAGNWNAVVAAAKKEGKVHFYTGQIAPVAERLVAGFRKVYPDIAVETVRGPSGQVLARVEQERNSGTEGADFFLSTEVGWFDEQARAGRLLKPFGPAAKDWPGQYLHEGATVIGGLEPYVIPYNKTLVPNPPRGYADLLRPEFRGKLGTTELASTVLVAWYEWLEKTQGPDYLPKLKAQNLKFYVGSTPTSQALASGEIAVAAFAVPTSMTALIEQGAAVNYVVPNPGFGVTYGMAALGWSKRPNAALVILDYFMSVDGQSAWHNRGDSASPRPGIKGALQASSINTWDPTKYPPEVVKASRERWTKLMK